MDLKDLKLMANKVRKGILECVYSANSGHPGGALSIADILTVLYCEIMNVSSKNPSDPNRDRLVLSKGHACPALYSVLANLGFFPLEDLKTFRKIDSHLPGHPIINKPIGVDSSSGSLGQGLSIAVGMALSFKLDKKENFVYAILGDGELQEGQIWEAVMATSHYKLNKLIAFVDNNNLQIDGEISNVMSPYPIDEKFKAFGWNVINIDGHNFEQIINAIKEAKLCLEKPTAIICKTIKGKGISFMENQAGWHGKAPNEEQFNQAMSELESEVI